MVLNRDEFINYVEETYSVTGEHPFTDDNHTTVFRHSENRKWFAIVMTVPHSRIKLDGGGLIDIVNVKCDPEVIYSFLSEKGMFPAYHMNKRHWITAALDGTADEDKIKWLLDISYDLTGIKRKKK